MMIMNKRFTLILAFFAFTACLWSQVIPSNGSGTKADPYQIENLDHLLWISEGDGGTTSMVKRWSSHYILMADVNAAATSSRNNGEGFFPIGNDIVPFSGSFDGNNHSISSLFIDNTDMYSGLFGLIEVVSGENYIKDLTLENVDITVGQASLYTGYYGALAGQSISMLISNCHVTGTITARETAINIGGMIGHFRMFTAVSDLLPDAAPVIMDCSTDVTITGGSQYAGGLIGYVYINLNQEDHRIENCSASGDVTSGSYVGGLIGNVNYITLSNCHASGNVTANRPREDQSYAGGLLGNSNAQVKNCYATGNVTGYEYEEVRGLETVTIYPKRNGGFAGSIYGSRVSSLIENCYSTGTVSGTDELGGFAGFIGDDLIEFRECYATGQLTGTGGLINGFVGSDVGVVDSRTYNKCYWDVETTGQSKFMGELDDTYAAFGLNTAAFAIQSNFVDWDFASVWHIGVIAAIDANARPYFQSQTLDSPTAIKNVALKVNVMPNPNNGIFSVNNVRNGDAIAIFSLAGTKVFETTAQGTTINLDISSQPSGIYILRIGSDAYKIIKK
jgi:hypothetical protein